MKLLEFGAPGAPAVLLVHGMGCSGEHSFASAIATLGERYRVLVPLLDGYDGEKSPFDSIETQARELTNCLCMAGYEWLHAAVGMSMGGFICLELFSKYLISTDKLILDSGYMDPLAYPRLVALAVSFGFHALKKGGGSRLINRAMDSMMGYRFRPEDLYPASRETVYNSELSCLTYRLPDNIQGIHANSIQFWYGSREKHMIKGLRTLQAILPGLRGVCMGDVGHGEIMFQHPAQYANRVLAALGTLS